MTLVCIMQYWSNSKRARINARMDYVTCTLSNNDSHIKKL